MGCTILNVVDLTVYPSVVDVSYGFADVDGSLLTGFENRMFQDPCEENDIIGNREAIGLVFTVTGAPKYPADIRFTVNYLRPGETVKRSWTANFSLADGTYEKFIYHTELKYMKGRYSGLTLGIDFLK